MAEKKAAPAQKAAPGPNVIQQHVQAKKIETEIAKKVLPYSPKYLDVLAVCCSDGRYIEAVHHFLAGRGCPQHDLLAFPGGPGQLCRETASYAESASMLDAFDFLVEAHKTREVLLIAHDHCGYYARRLGLSEVARQQLDLRRVRTRIIDKHPKIKVVMYFAHPPKATESGVKFEEMAAG